VENYDNVRLFSEKKCGHGLQVLLSSAGAIRKRLPFFFFSSFKILDDWNLQEELA